MVIANRDFRLTKASGWDSVALERVEESTKEGRGAEVGAVVCGEGESSSLCIGGRSDENRDRRDMPIVRTHDSGKTANRRIGTAETERRYIRPRQSRYHGCDVLLMLLGHGKLLLVGVQFAPAAGPLPNSQSGCDRKSWFHKRLGESRVYLVRSKTDRPQLYDYIFQQATLTSNKPLLASRSKWVKVHSNTHHVHSLVEALRAPEVAKMLQGAKFAREGVGLDK